MVRDLHKHFKTRMEPYGGQGKLEPQIKTVLLPQKKKGEESEGNKLSR